MPSNSPPIIKIGESQEDLSPLIETVEVSDRSGVMRTTGKDNNSNSDTVSASNSEWNTVSQLLAPDANIEYSIID